MRLRHITKHLQDQNWFAVALDFLIVVVGTTHKPTFAAAPNSPSS